MFYLCKAREEHASVNVRGPANDVSVIGTARGERFIGGIGTAGGDLFTRARRPV